MEHGMPAEILSDLGCNFSSEIMQEFYKLHTIKHLTIAAYHPRTNGRNEKFNGVVTTIIAKYLAEFQQPPEHWSHYMKPALFACRIRTISTHVYSPFFLNHLCDPLLPSNHLPFSFGNEPPIPTARINELANAVETRIDALNRRHAANCNTNSRLNQRVVHQTYNNGNLVLIEIPNPKKFRPKRYGPVLIAGPSLTGTPDTYRLKELNGKPILAPYHSDQLRRANLSATDLQDLLASQKPWADNQYRSQHGLIADAHPVNLLDI